jgi:hypothetical protein
MLFSGACLATTIQNPRPAPRNLKIAHLKYRGRRFARVSCSPPNPAVPPFRIHLSRCHRVRLRYLKASTELLHLAIENETKFPWISDPQPPPCAASQIFSSRCRRDSRRDIAEPQHFHARPASSCSEWSSELVMRIILLLDFDKSIPIHTEDLSASVHAA